ncbi:hypothetical protein RND81_10G212800 [Saponaria officinalis]|uniref:F-box domain-containing protein n=1 Tax=Saponaria officinalis TaxID=3572 RepID=A0AAW1I4Q4_SAPOF
MSSKEDDRLSSLPSDIMITILSLLPLKSAISTSILSRSWRYLWTHISALRFTSPYYVTNKFYLDLFRTLGRMSWQKIYTLELIISTQTTASRINIIELGYCLLCIGHSIKEFKVKFEIYDYMIDVPPYIFELQSIEVLELGGLGIRNREINYKLPKLRKLVIDIGGFDLECLGNLVKSCPMLEILRVNVDVRENLAYPIEIISRNLKWVCIILIDARQYFTQGKKKVVFDAPKLEYLEFNSPIMLKFCFLKTPSWLLRAKLSFEDDELKTGLVEWSINPKQGLLTLLNPIFRVKTLRLSGDILIGLSKIDQNKVQKFEKLTHVEMKLSNRSYPRFIGVNKFLQRCPNLQSLVLRRRCDSYFWMICLLPCMFGNIYEGNYDFRKCDFKIICNFANVVTDDKMMIEITMNVYRDDQLIKSVKDFVLKNQLWRLYDELEMIEQMVS